MAKAEPCSLCPSRPPQAVLDRIDGLLGSRQTWTSHSTDRSFLVLVLCCCPSCIYTATQQDHTPTPAFFSRRQLVLANIFKFKLQSREQLPLTALSSRNQFAHVLSRFITASMVGTLGQRQPSQVVVPVTQHGGLKKMLPYWYPYTTMAKERWLGREILEIVSTEFRDRSMEYYRYALESGVTTINGKVAKPDTAVRNGDRIENIVHRHEPPVTATPIKIVLHDDERDFLVIDKPGSIPVHASGRYYRHSLVEMLRHEFGFDRVYTINRLDRLTSGLMIIPLNADLARSLTSEFMNGSVRKEYVARCKGQFPVGEVMCEEPLLTVDRQMGLNIVHPEGKPAKTIFNRIRYDANTNTSVLRCRPLTGRSHQIRVHLQYLGHPIANDPVYSEERIWGPNLGKHGIDVIPSSERFAPAPPKHLQSDNNPESSAPSGTCIDPKSTSSENESGTKDENEEADAQRTKLLPRETGHDIGMGSPVALSAEAVEIITRLRNMKDENEDWSRWRDVVFRAKGALAPKSFRRSLPLPPQNKRKRGGRTIVAAMDNDPEHSGQGSPEDLEERPPTPPLPRSESSAQAQPTSDSDMAQLTLSEATSRLPSLVAPEPERDPATGTFYCSECYLPLHPDPEPEKLYIFLHALKYELSLGRFETELPEWAKEGWGQ